MIGWSAQNTIYNNKQNYVLGPYQILDDTIVSDTSITADKGVATQLVMAFDKANKPCTFNYYFQDINDESVYDLVYSFDLYTTGGWGNQDKAYKYEGFSLNEGKSTQTPSSGECDYYYDRQHYSIEVDNKGTILTDLTLTGLKFGQTTDYFDNLPMQQKYYPKNLEPNSHSFEGFYTTQEFIPGTEFNASTPMPAKSIRLYAHWVPLKHEVRFFETYNDLLKFNETGDESLILQTASGGVMNDPVSLVPHGDVLGAVDFPKYNEGGLEYNFAGWFYMINGVKATYTPLDMPVVRSLNVYADWGTLVAQPYRIKFAEYGTGKKIADDTYGHAYQGSTRTFIPKAGEPFDQLYDGYNTGWFPTLSSHSITIAAEEDKENPINNTFTFEYVKAENIPYMVRYVDKVTGEMLDEKRVEINDKAVVTERFKVFPNMLPDAFYKRLVLSVRVDDKGVPITMPEDNVITFYYTENTGAAPYAVHYMLQKPGTVGDKDEDYQLNSEHAEGMGDIGNEITIYPRQFSGFTMAESAKVLSGGVRVEDSAKFTDGGKDAFSFQVTAEGAEIYVYYKRNSYPYTVRYMLYGTDQKVREDSVYPKEEYDKLITCFAPAIDGYTAIAVRDKVDTH